MKTYMKLFGKEVRLDRLGFIIGKHGGYRYNTELCNRVIFHFGMI